MIGRLLTPLALAAAIVAPLSFVSADTAEAKPGWKHGGHGWHHGGFRGHGGFRRHGWHRGGPPRWAPAYGYRRHHWSYGGPRYSRW